MRQLDTKQVIGPLGSLALSQTKPHSVSASLRAIRWHADLDRLGISLPFAMVHDFGLVLTCETHQLTIATRVDYATSAPTLAAQCERYRLLLEQARDSETARRASRLAMSDDLIVAVIARLLGDAARSLKVGPSYDGQLPIDGALFERLDEASLSQLYGKLDRSFEQTALQAILSFELLILTLIDALDLDTLQLFSILGQAQRGTLAQVTLLESLEIPQAHDIVNFSLQLLPSVLETRSRPAAGSVAAFGYSGLGRRGSIDNMVLTELAWHDAELTRRLLDNEVLYYEREQEAEEGGREHLLLIDASASMRGQRATFARSMALASGKKLLLQGHEVVFRFFDSRLYEAHRAHGGALPTSHLLSFKGERGRHPARVFRELEAMLALHPQARRPAVQIFTHGALYIPRDLVAAVCRLSEVAAVFMLPSGGHLELDYLDLLDTHWVVDHSRLNNTQERAKAALNILDGDMSSESGTAATSRGKRHEGGHTSAHMREGPPAKPTTP